MSQDDILVDISLAKKILNADLKSAQLIIDDSPNSFHGRWLVEMWLGGSFFHYPCSSKCLSFIYEGINEKEKYREKRSIFDKLRKFLKMETNHD